MIDRTNNNKMKAINKIKQAEQSLTNSSLQFHSFIGSLREHRQEQPFNLPTPSEDSINPHNLQTNHKTNRSQIIPRQGYYLLAEKSMSNFSSQVPLSRKKDDDAAIKNKFRMSVGNRHRFDRYQLPTYCFSHVKQDLSQHLKQFKRQPEKHIQPPNPTPKKPLQRQNQFSQLLQARGLKGAQKPRRIKDLNSTIILKFCILNKLDFQSSPKEILKFFSKIIDLCNYQIAQPTIQKYKNCVYFGEHIKNNQHYQGIVYYFSGQIYYGELYNNHKSGYGVQISFQEEAFYKGQFRDDQKVGIFEVQKQGEKYYGELRNNLYHGRGRLIEAHQTYQGEFYEGQKVNSPNKKAKGRLSKRNDESSFTRKQYYTPEKPLTSSRTAYNDLSSSKIYRNGREQSTFHEKSSNPWRFSQQPRKTKQKKVAWSNPYQNTRQFNFALDDPEENSYHPEQQHSRRTSKAASLRIRQIGKLRNRPIVQQQEQQPLRNRI